MFYTAYWVAERSAARVSRLVFIGVQLATELFLGSLQVVPRRLTAQVNECYIKRTDLAWRSDDADTNSGNRDAQLYLQAQPSTLRRLRESRRRFPLTTHACVLSQLQQTGGLGGSWNREEHSRGSGA